MKHHISIISLLPHIDLLSIFPYGRTKGITSICTESQAYELSPTTSLTYITERFLSSDTENPSRFGEVAPFALHCFWVDSVFSHPPCTLKYLNFIKYSKLNVIKNLRHQTRKWFLFLEWRDRWGALKKIRTVYQRLNMLLIHTQLLHLRKMQNSEN